MAIKAVANLHPHETLSPPDFPVQMSPEASFHGPGAPLDAFERSFWHFASPAKIATGYWQPWYVTSDIPTRARDISITLSMAPRAGLQRNAAVSERGPASAPCFAKAAARPWPAAREPMPGPHRETRTAASSRKIPDACGRRSRAERRAADRPTPEKRSTPSASSPRSRRNTTHTTPESTPRPARATRPRLTPAPAAVAQDLPHEADAREEDGPEPAHPQWIRMRTGNKIRGTRSGGTGAARSSASSRVA